MSIPAEPRDWNQRYVSGDTPWDSGKPSAELARVVREWNIRPCCILELGCGTGENAVYLAQQGFETAFDVAPLAIQQAQIKVHSAGVAIRLLTAGVFNLPDWGPPFPFVFRPRTVPRGAARQPGGLAADVGARDSSRN
jgi:SAM-dependent methyltransferase